MSLALKRLWQNKQSKNPILSGLPVPTVSVVNWTATVEMVGMIEEGEGGQGCVLYPGDRLRLRPVSMSELSTDEGTQQGELFLIEATHPSIKILYPQVLFARRYGNFLILDLPHQPTIDLSDATECTKWHIVGVVKGVERSLSSGIALGQDKWWIKIHGIDAYVSNVFNEWLHYIESQPLPPEYLAELVRFVSPMQGVSIQAGWSKEALYNCVLPNPETIVFSMHKPETASGFVSSWAVASKRRLRRKRLQRRQHSVPTSLYPLPTLECVQKQDDSNQNNLNSPKNENQHSIPRLAIRLAGK